MDKQADFKTFLIDDNCFSYLYKAIRTFIITIQGDIEILPIVFPSSSFNTAQHIRLIQIFTEQMPYGHGYFHENFKTKKKVSFKSMYRY